MPAKFWGEAVVTAVHLLNRSPTKSLQGKTPYEAWYGRAPVVAHLRVYGCLCFAKELNQVRKLDDRSRPGVFLGYADGAKAYRVYDPVSRRVLVSRDVIFDEAGGWDWNSSAEHAASMVEELRSTSSSPPQECQKVGTRPHHCRLPRLLCHARQLRGSLVTLHRRLVRRLCLPLPQRRARRPPLLRHIPLLWRLQRQ